MRIQHNIMAMNAYRNLGKNNGALNKNLEKLSSGYRINRAGDDAAGLAISEKMRAQIAGLDQAQKNAQSGINMVQTAEGALTEVHDMLNRMVTLTTQAANGTYSPEDRQKIQSEVDALTEEIDRIAENSNFNGTKLLNGDLDGNTSVADNTSLTAASLTKKNAAVEGSAGATGQFAFDLSQLEITNTSNTDLTVTFTIGDKTIGMTVTKGTTAKAADIATALNTGTATLQNQTDAVSFTSKVDGDKIVFTMDTVPTATTATGSAFELNIDLTASTTYLSCNQGQSIAAVDVKQAEAKTDMVYASSSFSLGTITDGSVVQIGDEKYLFAVGKDSKYTKAVDGYTTVNMTDRETTDSDFAAQAAAALVNAAKNNEKVIVSTDGTDIYITEKNGKIDHDTELNASLEFEADFVKTGTYSTQTVGTGGKAMALQIGASKDESIDVEIKSMKAEALGIKGLSVTNETDAKASLDKINDAIESVSVQRSELGAIQNRLEHTINNLGVMEENIQDAEANIRDTDIAEEMMAYTKNNILIQSAQAMLAQANQVPQGVLQLMG